ncbi:YchJ family protein [Desulfogranum japonicum]|uniref:YchJ family protein n=1 Tax=Desulfogranum japonicum TaxID=231447 RepID=UPI0003FB1973|nr:YchJ family metal-binding protein [Desulfogranum japonicum]
MSKTTPLLSCPCGSASSYAQCCEPYLEGRENAPTAEALMRSRFTAYTRADTDYLLKTWHPETRPTSIDKETIPHWYDLQILATNNGNAEDEHGTVEFLALARTIHNQSIDLHEKSRFVKIDSQWVYHSGDLTSQAESKKPGRNKPCPCGSGKKYKKCCAR